MASASNATYFEANEELTEFFQMLDALFSHLEMSIVLNDTLDLKHCKCKLERNLPIVTAMLVAVNNERYDDRIDLLSPQPSFVSLLERLSVGIEEEIRRLRAILDYTSPENRREVISFIRISFIRISFHQKTLELLKNIARYSSYASWSRY